MKNAIFSLGLFIALTLNSEAQKLDKRIYETNRINNEAAPKIDGLIDDYIWDEADWSQDFTQSRPTEGDPPSQETKFKIIYDDRKFSR